MRPRRRRNEAPHVALGFQLGAAMEIELGDHPRAEEVVAGIE